MDIYLRLIGDLGLDETVLIEGTESAGDAEENEGNHQEGRAISKETTEISAKISIDKTVPNTHPHT